MDLTPYLAGLRQDLAATAAAGGEQTRQAATLLVTALEPAARLALMNALADMAAEVTARLPGQTVEVRLDGRDVKVSVTDRAHPADAETGPDAGPDGSRDAATGQRARQTSQDAAGDISRITVRLMEEIKARAEQAAATQGQSLNAFVSQAVQQALTEAGRRAGSTGGQPGGERLRGWARW